jgi:hypothetical protein
MQFADDDWQQFTNMPYVAAHTVQTQTHIVHLRVLQSKVQKRADNLDCRWASKPEPLLAILFDDQLSESINVVPPGKSEAARKTSVHAARVHKVADNFNGAAGSRPNVDVTESTPSRALQFVPDVPAMENRSYVTKIATPKVALA